MFTKCVKSIVKEKTKNVISVLCVYIRITCAYSRNNLRVFTHLGIRIHTWSYTYRRMNFSDHSFAVNRARASFKFDFCILIFSNVLVNVCFLCWFHAQWTCRLFCKSSSLGYGFVWKVRWVGRKVHKYLTIFRIVCIKFVWLKGYFWKYFLFFQNKYTISANLCTKTKNHYILSQLVDMWRKNAIEWLFSMNIFASRIIMLSSLLYSGDVRAPEWRAPGRTFCWSWCTPPRSTRHSGLADLQTVHRSDPAMPMLSLKL